MVKLPVLRQLQHKLWFANLLSAVAFQSQTQSDSSLQDYHGHGELIGSRTN